MVNLLVVYNDFYSVQKIINKLIFQNSEIRLYNISASIKESLNFININKSDIDIVILYLSKNKIQEFINNLDTDSKAKLKNSIIIITNEKIYLKEELNLCINNVIKNDNISDIITSINDLSLFKEKHKNYVQNKAVINRYLYSLGYNFSHKGTLYIAETLYILLNTKSTKCPILKKEIYPIIAEKHNTTIHNVNCTITLATKYMNIHIKDKIKKNLFENLFNDYITTKNVINLLLFKETAHKH